MLPTISTTGSTPTTPLLDPLDFTGGCACTTTGKSGNTQTGQLGCRQRADSGLLFPISMCYVVQPSSCLAGMASVKYPGAAWKMC